MSGDHDQRRQGGGGESWRSPGGGGGGHGRMNKTIPCGWGFPYEVFFYVGGGSPMRYFSMWAGIFTPRRGHFFRMLWGVFLVCPPLTFFLLEPL